MVRRNLSDGKILHPAVRLGFTLMGLSSDLVVRRQRFAHMVSCGEAEALRLLLLLHLGQQQEAPLKGAVKELSAGKGQRLFRQQSFQSSTPPAEHRFSHSRRTVSRAEEYLRSKNLEPTEVQSAVLKETKDKQIRDKRANSRQLM